ncbi:uncharacterized mitochondrial protein-like protein [Tanacetum coccineum]
MGELIFFLGLQVKQKEDEIFISQDKYVSEILKKFGFTDVKTASTPMETQKLLLKDEDGEEVDVHLYRSMIGSSMYLTSLRHDIMFLVCACARYQVNLKVSHLYAVKRIFRYLKVIKTNMAECYITKCSYWSIPTKGMLRGLKKAHKEWGFYTKSCLKEAQRPLTHGCHVGNPCAPQSNPTVQVKHQMIEGMKGQD